MARSFPTVPFERLIRTYAGYASDVWKVTPRLTLTYGMRYQYYAVPKDKNGREALFDPATASIVVPNGSLKLVSKLLPSNYVKVVEAGQAGYPAGLLAADKNNFAPRLSLAWRVWATTPSCAPRPGCIMTTGRLIPIWEPSFLS